MPGAARNASGSLVSSAGKNASTQTVAAAAPVTPLDNTGAYGAQNAYQSPESALGSIGSGIVGGLKSFVSNMFGGGAAQKAMATQSPYYQVKPGDSFQSIGITPQKYMAYNQGVKTLPSSGSYIATGYTSEGGMSRNTVPTSSPYTSEGGMSRNYTGNPVQAPAQYRGNALGGMPNVSDQQLMGEIQNIQLMNTMNKPVTAMSFQAAAAQGYTPQGMAQQGWVQNFVTGQWVPKPANAAPSNWVAPNATTNAPGGRGNRGGGAIRNAKGSLRNPSRGLGNNGAAAVVPLSPDNAAASSQTVLGLRMGSG
jgi:hypothetical protein